MHILLYEWATGGGLVDEPGALPASLLREGLAMVNAVAADLGRIAGCRVTVLRDPRVLQLAAPGCRVVDVLSSFSHSEEIERISGEADATILIAPEFDGILLRMAERVAGAGGRLLSPAPEFIRIAANKQQTCEMLASAGVATPFGLVLESDEPLPASFSYPAVLKPVDGAGSQDTYLVRGAHDAPPAYAWPRRLERFMRGLAASVAVVCGPTRRVVLAPCSQRISGDGRFHYLGGEVPIARGLAARATALAERTLNALPPTTGYVGIDVVLGSDPHGSEDAVIEVNPRLTTSYVGLRAAAQANLAHVMWQIAEGASPTVEFSSRRIEFDAAGNVSFLE
jgi:tyramine---L-glutamate ligase